MHFKNHEHECSFCAQSRSLPQMAEARERSRSPMSVRWSVSSWKDLLLMKVTEELVVPERQNRCFLIIYGHVGGAYPLVYGGCWPPMARSTAILSCTGDRSVWMPLQLVVQLHTCANFRRVTSQPPSVFPRHLGRPYVCVC